MPLPFGHRSVAAHAPGGDLLGERSALPTHVPRFSFRALGRQMCYEGIASYDAHPTHDIEFL